MSDIIRLLPDHIANQIAAGEVVQRPASCVKELLENAIDAGSTQVKLIVKDAGKLLVQVMDNGKGMSETDARMAFERHATSKIAKAEDLFDLHTFGFRGEALASIAAVAQVELKTRTASSEIGVLIKNEASQIVTNEHVACEVGTSIAVKNLFYNIPARRNFLKSNPIELGHIENEFIRVALAEPEIAFSYFADDKEIYQFSSSKLIHRIIQVFGKNYREELIPCDEDTNVVKLSGYIGKPHLATKQKDKQYFFVNGRYVRSPYLAKAVEYAFADLIEDGKYPFFVLFLDIDPKRIDVNVHPTKTEIKFEDEKVLFQILRSAVQQALVKNNAVDSIDFTFDTNYAVDPLARSQFENDQNPLDIKPVSLNKSNYSGGNQSFKHDRNNNWQAYYGDSYKQSSIDAFENEGTVKLESKMNSLNSSSSSLSTDLLYAENNSTFQLHQSYIVTQIKSGMALIDQSAAHERILYEKYHKMLDANFGASQQFLFPQSIELSHSDFELVMEMEKDLRSLGFVFNVFSQNTIVLNGIPADIPDANETNLFQSLIAQYKENVELKVDRKENLARSIAKKSAIKKGQKLSLQEMNALIEQLFACAMPHFCPQGKPTLILLSLDKINQMFQ